MRSTPPALRRTMTAGKGLFAFGCVALAFAGCRGELTLEPVPAVTTTAPGEALRGELQALRTLVERARREGVLSASERAGAFGDAGRRYHALEFLAPAAVCYRNALRLDGGNPEWPYYLGQITLAESEPGEAAEWFARAVELEPRVGLTRLMQGRALSLAGNQERALAAFERALELDPELALAHAWAGDIALGRRQFERAVEAFNLALQLQPDAGVLYVPLAQALRALDRTDEAAAALAKRNAKLVSVVDGRLHVLLQLAVTTAGSMQRGSRAFEQGDFAAAAAAFREATEIDGESADAQLNLGAALTRLGDAPGAEAALRNARRLAPDSAKASFNLGSLLCAVGRTEEGVSALGDALRLQPDFAAARQRRAEGLMASAAYAAAAEDYLQLSREAPAEVSHWQRGVIALALADRRSEARSLADRGLESHRDAPLLLVAKSRLLATEPEVSEQDAAEALALIRPLVQASSDIATVEALAMAFAANGQFVEAVAWQRRALDAVRGSGRQDLVPSFEETLELYLSSRPAAQPWSPATWAL